MCKKWELRNTMNFVEELFQDMQKNGKKLFLDLEGGLVSRIPYCLLKTFIQML